MSFLSAINPNNWLSGAIGKTDAGLGNRFGGILNDLTGASASARQQFNNNMALQHDAQNFAKWQMANSHQLEVQDLIAAGLNPILSANGGASAGVSANSTGSGTPSGNPIEMIGSIFNMLNTAKQTNATVDKIKSDIKNETSLTKANIGRINAETKNIDQNTLIHEPDTTEADVDEKLGQLGFIGKNIKAWGKILKWGNAKLRGITGSAINAATSARNANRMADAIKNTPHTHVHYH